MDTVGALPQYTCGRHAYVLDAALLPLIGKLYPCSKHPGVYENIKGAYIKHYERISLLPHALPLRVLSYSNWGGRLTFFYLSCRFDS